MDFDYFNSPDEILTGSKVAATSSVIPAGFIAGSPSSGRQVLVPKCKVVYPLPEYPDDHDDQRKG